MRLITESQHDNNWLNERKKLITATDISSILDSNPFKTKRDLLLEKCYKNVDSKFINNNIYNNNAVEWGNKYEDVARNLYEELTKQKVFTTGLLKHGKIDYLGASPDGIVFKRNDYYNYDKNKIINDDIINKDLFSKLVEFKCPFKRVFKKVPVYYWIQVQIQMEVCNLNECDLFMCKFDEYENFSSYANDVLHKKGKLTYKNKDYYWKLSDYTIFNIKRDSKWFNSNFSVITKFHEDMKYYQNGNNIEELINVRKRKFNNMANTTDNSDDRNTRKKFRTCIDSNDVNVGGDTNNIKYTDYKNWITPSEMRNYMLDDPLIDYLNRYGYKHSIIPDPKQGELGFCDYVSKKGNDFETKVIEIMRNKHPNDFVEIGDKNCIYKNDLFNKTVEHMKNGTYIIYHGFLRDEKEKMYGVPDLLVRSDFINKLFYSDLYDENLVNIQNTINNKKYHYVPIDIKYTTLNILSDKKSLSNGIDNIYYKSQLFLYNKMLSSIQGYSCHYGYVIGRKYNYVSKNLKSSITNNIFDKLGRINFNDLNLVEKTSNAVKWIQDLKDNGDNWKFFNETYYNNYLSKSPTKNIEKDDQYINNLNINLKNIRKELFPNMNNNNDHPWHNFKKNLAFNIGEITYLWYCSKNVRDKCHQSNIYSFYDAKINNFDLELSDSKKDILNGILKVNSYINMKVHYNNDDLIALKNNIFKNIPHQITDNITDNTNTINETISGSINGITNNIESTMLLNKDNNVDFYVDFETTSDIYDSLENLPNISRENNDRIFMIGMGWICPFSKEWNFKKFITHRLDNYNEEKILKDWLYSMKYIKNFYSNNEYKTNIYHWGHAEQSWYKKSYDKYNIDKEFDYKNLNWIDLCQNIKKNPIFIKDAYNFSLKNYARALFGHKLIDTNWEDNNLDGVGAMVSAWYSNEKAISHDISIKQIPIIKEVTRYNEVDCKVLMEICRFIKHLKKI